MTLLFIEHQQASIGLIGWIIAFAAFYFLKDVLFKKDKSNNNNEQQNNK